MTLGLVLTTACDPLEDINEELDAKDNPIVGNIEYTLTEEDYEELGLSFGTFGSVEEAKELIPGLLTEMYPQWGKGSSVVAGYELYIGSADGVSDYSGAEIYQLTNADYASTGSDAFGFYPNVNADAQIPAILAAEIASPTEGQIILAKYDQYYFDPVVGLADIVNYAFPANFADFEQLNIVGDQVWTEESSYAQANGYSGGQNENEDWLISPQIDLTSATDLKFQVNQYIKYASDFSLMKILVSTNYTTGGDQSAASWDEINLAITPPGGDNFVLSEDFDFSAYDGQTIHVAFKYNSTDSDAARWRIEHFAIKNLGVSGDANHKGTHFTYTDGEWEKSEGVYYLSSADFDSMGEGSGQPGRYNNFGSTTPPGDYLPTFLASTPPFAYGQQDDELIVVYNYFSSSSGAQIRGNRYTFTDEMWVGHTSVISTFLQFGHDGSGWVPDNTIQHELIRSDYTLIGDALIGDYPGPAASCANYGNFDRRSGNANYWSNEMLAEGFDVLLNTMDPGAQEGQKYVMTYNIYNGAAGIESLGVIKTDGIWVLQ